MRKHCKYVIIRILIFQTLILHGLATYPDENTLTVAWSTQSFFKPKRLISFQSKRWMPFESKRWMSFEAIGILVLKSGGKVIQLNCFGMSKTTEKLKIRQDWNSVIVFKPIHYSMGNTIQVLEIFKWLQIMILLLLSEIIF